jgi:hypothetical protein
MRVLMQAVRLKILLIALAFLVAGCHDDEEVGFQKHTLHFILRPDDRGRWYIQDDIDHMPSGVKPFVTQSRENLYVEFKRTYSHAGTVQVTPDDDFHGRITAGSNLGRSSVTISLKANGEKIDPATIYSRGIPAGAGNLWVNITMMDK